MKTPNFFIVGAPKCGTTAMSVYLKQHPEVFIPHKKEPHFFGTDLSSPVFYKDKERYLSLFVGAGDEKRLGEASVWYLYSKRAAEEIKEFAPEARIIIMLRDPVEMIYSLHSQLLYSGDEDIEDFQAALNAEEDRKKGLRIPKRARVVQGLCYRETAKYTKQVERYLHVFGPEAVNVIIFDDFKNDPAGVYRKTLRFLEVDPGFRTELRSVNPNTRVRSKVLRELGYKNPPKIARWFARLLTPGRMRGSLGKTLKRYNTRTEVRRPLDPELSKRLRAEFAPEVKQLSELLDRDLTHWSRK